MSKTTTPLNNVSILYIFEISLKSQILLIFRIDLFWRIEFSKAGLPHVCESMRILQFPMVLSFGTFYFAQKFYVLVVGQGSPLVFFGAVPLEFLRQIVQFFR